MSIKPPSSNLDVDGGSRRPASTLFCRNLSWVNLFDFDRADLVFGDLGNRVDRGVGQRIGSRLGKVEGDENDAGLDALGDAHAQLDLAAPAGDAHAPLTGQLDPGSV